MPLDSQRLVPSKKDSFYWEHIQRYIFVSKYTKAKTVLDLGCGVGYGSYFLATRKATNVVGIDIDPKAIKYAKGKFKVNKLKFVIGNAESLPFPDSTFDVVISFEVIEHVMDYKKFLKESFRVLKPKGYLIISTPNRLGIRGGTSPYHIKEFTAAELRRLLPGVQLYGQFFKRKEYLKSEAEYFSRYQILTFGGNKLVKRILHLISPNFKARIYKALFRPSKAPLMKKDDVEILRGKLKASLTLIGIVRK